MIPITQFNGRDVAVFGLGRTGLSAARALMAGGATVHAWDDGEAARGAAEAQGIPLSDINRRDWQGFAALVLSPGIPLTHPQPHRVVRMAQSLSIPVIGDIELFAAEVNALPDQARPRIIGITGTNGKSTTTELIGHILRNAGRDVRVGGNIGRGVLDLEPLHASAVYVLELSSYQLDLTHTLRCDAAVLLNLTADHLERHGGMDGYEAAKMRIFNNQQRGDWAVVGVDSRRTQALAMGLNQKPAGLIQISASMALGNGVCAIDGELYETLTGRSVHAGSLLEAAALPGRHNHQNAAAAYAVARTLGVSSSLAVDGILSFKGLAHRMETVLDTGRVRFINDSKATNAEAAEQALKAFPSVYWIAGGRAKAGGIAPLEPLFDRVRAAYLIGESTEDFAQTLDGKAPVRPCANLQDAVRSAARDAEEAGGGIVLLSPAAASFDQFTDFEERGNVFRAMVSQIAAKARRAAAG